MTREQAKREIDSLDFYLQNHTDDYGEESHTAMMMAIKALEQQTCEDAVSRKAAIDAAINGADDWDGGYSPTREEYIKKAINALPPVNPQPKVGHWIKYGELYQCSECKELSCCQCKFCNECGAKMVEPQEGEGNK